MNNHPPILRNKVRDKLARDEVVASMTARLIRGIEVAQIAATAGFDSLYVDLEHGPLTIDITGQICLAALAVGVTPFVRVPAIAPEFVGRVLDAGALGHDRVGLRVHLGRSHAADLRLQQVHIGRDSKLDPLHLQLHIARPRDHLVPLIEQDHELRDLLALVRDFEHRLLVGVRHVVEVHTADHLGQLLEAWGLRIRAST